MMGKKGELEGEEVKEREKTFRKYKALFSILGYIYCCVYPWNWTNLPLKLGFTSMQL